MLRTIFLLITAALTALLVWVGLKPAHYTVERTAVIAAAPADVFAHVYDFEKWADWSPWAKRDPNAKVTFEGPRAGPGAIMKWSGNEEVGTGAMAITEANPPQGLKIRLDFVAPMHGTSDVGFIFQPEGPGTKVTWSIAGEQGFVERLICTVMGLDVNSMIGADYETGLANLKRVAEAAPPAAAVGPPPG
jgi:uncharacterized protein YndB with AHSA1/START domain